MIASLIFSLLFSVGCLTFVKTEAEKTHQEKINNPPPISKPLEGEDTLNDEFKKKN